MNDLFNPDDLETHAGWLRRLAVCIAGDADAMDLVQETYIAAWRAPPDAERPLRPWLATVLRNAWRMRARGAARRQARELAVVADENVEPPTPEELANKASVYRALADSVMLLEEPYRHTVLLRYFEGQGSNEIAARDGVPPGTVRWRLQEGLKRLHKDLELRFGSRAAWCGLLFGSPSVGKSSSPLAASTAPLSSGSSLAAQKVALGLLVLMAAALVPFGLWQSNCWRPDASPAESRATSRRPAMAGEDSFMPGPADPEASSSDGVVDEVVPTRANGGRTRDIGTTAGTPSQEPSADTACVADGSLDAKGLDAALDAAMPQISLCARGCEGDRCVGQFRVNAVVVADGARGRLDQATIDEDYSVQNPSLASCVISALAAVEYPRPASETARLDLPFLVTRGKEDQAAVIRRPTVTTADAKAPHTVAWPTSFAGSPTRGAADAPVTIIEYLDFECPFCGRVLDTLREIEEAYSDQVRIVFRARPMPFHPRARLAAVAALAAHQQGRFWEYHDLLFANTNALDRASLIRFAGELGLDVARFCADMDSKALDAVVEADLAEAAQVGATGTPSFVVNGTLIIGARSFEELALLIDAALADRFFSRYLFNDSSLQVTP